MAKRKKWRDPGAPFRKLVELQGRLRAPRGCPWDRKQTHASLRPYLLEETYEVLEAIDARDNERLVAELGDLLLQIVFHAQLAREAGRFDIAEVIERIHSKMVRRHPHVFGATKARTAGEVLKNWEQLKAEERRQEKSPGDGSLLAGLQANLPALLEAYQLTRRAARIGFDWENIAGLLEKLEEEAEELRRELRPLGPRAPGKAAPAAAGLEPITPRGDRAGAMRWHRASAREGKGVMEIPRLRSGPVSGPGKPGPPDCKKRRFRQRARTPAERLKVRGAAEEYPGAKLEEEMGDLLFVAANVARFLGLDPEITLRKANRKFRRRFREMERLAERRGQRLAEVSRPELEALWEEAKRRRARPPDTSRSRPGGIGPRR